MKKRTKQPNTALGMIDQANQEQISTIEDMEARIARLRVGFRNIRERLIHLSDSLEQPSPKAEVLIIHVEEGGAQL